MNSGFDSFFSGNLRNDFGFDSGFSVRDDGRIINNDYPLGQSNLSVDPGGIIRDNTYGMFRDSGYRVDPLGNVFRQPGGYW